MRINSNQYEFTSNDFDTDVFYENQILSWDNRSGIVSLAIDTDPNYTYNASFFYEAHDLEYTSLVLNPLQDFYD